MRPGIRAVYLLGWPPLRSEAVQWIPAHTPMPSGPGPTAFARALTFA